MSPTEFLIVAGQKAAGRKIHEVPAPESRQAVPHNLLAADASARDISLFPGFPEPVRPLGDASTDSATADLVALINRWAVLTGSDDYSSIEEFIIRYPDSMWTLGMRFNLGKLYYSGGYFSKAIAVYQTPLEAKPGIKGEVAESYLSMMVAELAEMYARTGRQDDLAALLDRQKERPFSDRAKAGSDRAREGLALMRSQPGIAFRCGTFALANVARKMDMKIPSDFMDNNPSTKIGFSLAQLQKISREQLHFDTTVVTRTAGSKIPLPSVMHLRCGHYGALIEESGGYYHLSDPTFGKDIWITARAIDNESSGYFLIPQTALPAGWSPVPEEEAGQIFGKGLVTVIDPKATKKCDKSTGQCSDDGMATCRMHLAAVSLSVSDSPLTIPTAFGPGLTLQVTYNQREYEPALTKTYTNFGPQWVSGLVSWLEDNSSVDAADVTVYLPGGGSEVHSGYHSTGTSQGYYDLDVLRVSPLD